MAPVRVMSFNARMDTTQPDGSDGDDGSDAWPHRRELLLEDIAAQSPDLLGMQEVLPHMGAWLREQLEPAGYGFAGKPRGGDGTGEMMAVFYRKSRFTLLDSGHFWLSETPDVPGSFGPDFRCERMATWLQLSDSSGDGGSSLLFVNTHLDHGLDSARVFGAKVIMSFLEGRAEAAAAAAEPVIVTGDMNAHDDSDAIATLRSGAPGTAAQLVDTYRELYPEHDEMESSSHGWFKPRTAEMVARYGDRPAPPFGRRIDYILASAASFKVTTAAIDRFEDTMAATSKGSGLGLDDGGGRFGRGRFPSDHFAVVATLEYATAVEARPAL